MTRHVQVFISKGTTLNPAFEPGVNLVADGRHIDLPNWLDLMVSTENPSDQPLGEVIHFFDREFLDNNLPAATHGGLEKRD